MHTDNDLDDNTEETDSMDSTEESGDIFGSTEIVGSTTNHQETLQVNDETDSIDSTKESGDILGSEINIVGSTAYHQETIQVNNSIDEEVRCTNLLNPDTSPTWQEKESVKEEKKAIDDDFEEKQGWPVDHETTDNTEKLFFVKEVMKKKIERFKTRKSILERRMGIFYKGLFD